MNTKSPNQIIKADRVFDAKSGTSFDKGAIKIEGSKITAIGKQSDFSNVEDAQEYIFEGATLLPGLVDSHVHLTMPGDGSSVEDAMSLPDELLTLRAAYNAKNALLLGTTTLRELGAKNSTTFRMREGISRGLAIGPRLLLSGRPVTRTGGHCWMMGSEADGEDMIRKEVRTLVREGADFIKIMATGGGTAGTISHKTAYTLAELSSAIDEAHTHGRLTAIHCLSSQAMEDVVQSGGDMIIHGVFNTSDGTQVFDPRLAEKIAKSGISVNPTIHVRRIALKIAQQIIDESEDERQTVQRMGELQKNMQNDPEKANMSPQDIIKLLEKGFEDRVGNARNLLESGIKLIAGTDSGWGAYPIGSFVDELECMEMAGLNPGEVLLSATIEAAKSIGCDDRVGSLEIGKQADLLVVAGDPTEDIAALRSVEAVFLAGERVA